MKKIRLIGLISAFGVYISAQNAILYGKSSPKDLIPPPPAIEFFSLGLKPQFADSFWVRAIQDFDYCENEITKQRCQDNTWLSQMLDTITNLDPNYRVVYAMGGMALSVVISDVAGAARLFDKGVTQFPNDWQIQYKAGYHALLEERDNMKAAQRFEAAARHGAPQWLLGLSGRLYSEAGRQEAADRLIDELLKSDEDKWIAERLKKRIAERKAQESSTLKK